MRTVPAGPQFCLGMNLLVFRRCFCRAFDWGVEDLWPIRHPLVVAVIEGDGDESIGGDADNRHLP